MNLDEFSWHPILAPHLGDAGIHLKRGGPAGEVYAAVTTMQGEPWLAILNLHQDTTKVRGIQCDTELEAVGLVETWLDGILAGS